MTKPIKTECCDLLAWLGELEREVGSPRNGEFTFTETSFPRLPNTMTTANLQIRKGFHFIDDCYRADVLNFRADKKRYRCFGLAILAVVFCRELPELKICLTNEDSDIKLIKIGYRGTTPRTVYEYLTAPHSFRYHPESLEENPWTGASAERGMPDFKLQYSGKRSWEHWEDRDVVVGFGSDDASVRVAAMLLDFGSQRNKRRMVKLETIAGYGGVSRVSAEARFHLPDSDQWAPRNQ